MEKVLPKGWVETTLKEINFRKSKNIKPNNFPDEKFESYSVPIFPEGKPEIVDGKTIKSSKQVVFGKEILLCKINPRINRVWEVGNFSNHQKIASSEWIIVDTNKTLETSYLKYIFSAPQFRKLMQSDVSGVGGSLTRARPKIVEHYPFPLPPLAEQKRIVKKLDGLFGHLEKVEDLLAKVPQLLKDFRQSVLTMAVSGQLTEEWRRGKDLESVQNIYDNIQKDIDENYERLVQLAKKNGHRKPRNQRKNKKSSKSSGELINLPSTWKYYRLEDLSYLVTDGVHHKPKYKEDGVKFYSVRNVRPFKIKDEKYKYVSEDDHNKFIIRCHPEKNDILYTKVGATYGYAAKINFDYPVSIFVSLALIKPSRILNSDYVELVMNSPTIFNQANYKISGSGVPDLHLIEIRDFKFPLCSLPEQAEIVRQVEHLFQIADSIEAQYKVLKAKVEVLPQAILAKAFRGELVEQLDTDGDAKVLLEEIRKMKAALKPKKKRRKK